MPRIGRELRPVSYPRGKVRRSDFEVAVVEVPDPGPGEVLVRNTWTSVDPALRIRLRERAPAGYFPSFPLGAAMDGILTIGEVVESRADGFDSGDTVWHAAGWRDHDFEIERRSPYPFGRGIRQFPSASPGRDHSPAPGSP